MRVGMEAQIPLRSGKVTRLLRVTLLSSKSRAKRLRGDFGGRRLSEKKEGYADTGYRRFGE